MVMVVLVVLVVLLLVSGGADILLSLDKFFLGGKQGDFDISRVNLADSALPSRH